MPRQCLPSSGSILGIDEVFLHHAGFPGGLDGLKKNLPEVQETWVQTLGQEDPPEKGKATHSRILTWRIPWTEEPGGYSPWGQKESDITEWLTSPFSASCKSSRKTDGEAASRQQGEHSIGLARAWGPWGTLWHRLHSLLSRSHLTAGGGEIFSAWLLSQPSVAWFQICLNPVFEFINIFKTWERWSTPDSTF